MAAPASPLASDSIVSAPSQKVSVIICVRNGASTIERVLQSVVKNGPGQLIVVDGSSTDGTREIAARYANVVLQDPGTGLAEARNVGLTAVTRPYVLFPGADNVLPEGYIERMVTFFQSHSYSGLSSPTLVEGTPNYWSRAMNLYKKARYFPGERLVIGTPTFFESDNLCRYRYDPNVRFSDDSDLCERMAEDGHRFCITDMPIYEVGVETYPAICRRWDIYGIGDHDYYRKYAGSWGTARKLRSWLHPLKVEFWQPLFVHSSLLLREKFYVLPFLTVITILRYHYWLKEMWKPRWRPERKG